MSTYTQQDRSTDRRQTQTVSTVPVLWQLQISHYVERVRWALDHKCIPHVRRTLLPGLHAGVDGVRVARRQQGQRPAMARLLRRTLPRRTPARGERTAALGGARAARTQAASARRPARRWIPQPGNQHLDLAKIGAALARTAQAMVSDQAL